MRLQGFIPPEPTGLAFAAGFYFSFRTVIVLLSVRVLGTEPRTGAEMSVGIDFLLLLLVCFHSLGFARRTFQSMSRLWSVRWVLVFLIFSGCSLLWSETASPATAVVYWCELAATVAIVVLLLRAGPVRTVSESIMKGFVWGVCVVALTVWLLPAQSDLRLGDDELLGPNNIAYPCAFALFFAQYLLRKTNPKWGLAIFWLAITVLRCLSKTTIVALFVSEMFLLIRDKSVKPKIKVALVLAAILTTVAFWTLFTAYYDIYSNAGYQAETLTGRLGIWTYMLSEAIHKPWVGHGFDSVWKVIPPFGSDQFEPQHAHNELFQLFYVYGAIGVVMMVGTYGSLYRMIRKLAARPQRIFFLSFLLFVLVRGIADTDRFDLSFPLWAIVMVSLLMESARASDGDSRLEAVLNQRIGEKLNVFS